MELTIQAVQQTALPQQPVGAVQNPEGTEFEAMVRTMMAGGMPIIPAQEQKGEEPGQEQQSLMAALAAEAQPVFAENTVQTAEQIEPLAEAAETVDAAQQTQIAAQPRQTAAQTLEGAAQGARQDAQPAEREAAAQDVKAIRFEQPVAQTARQESRTDDFDTAPELRAVENRQDGRKVAEEAPLFTVPLEAAPVKVAEAVVNLEAPEAPEALAQQIVPSAEQFSGEQSELMIQVEPAELGPVKVTFSKDSQGVLQVRIEAQNPKAMTLLEKHNPQLQNLLNANLKGTVQVLVQKTENPWLQNENWNGHQQQGRQQQQQERRQETKESVEDFLHRLRLGLVGVESIAS